MSLHAILECALHVDLFRNIDLFQQGLYQVRIRMWYEQQGKSIPDHTCVLHPYDLKVVSRAKDPLPDPHHVTPSQLLHSRYCSNSFLVKYTDEEISVSDICFFRGEIPLERYEIQGAIVVVAQLMFLEPSCNASFEYLQSMTLHLKDFKEVSSAKLILRDPFYGTHSYFPVLFDESHFSCIDLCVHTALIDYHIPPPASPRSLPSPCSDFFFPGLPHPSVSQLAQCYEAYIKPVRKGGKALLRMIETLQLGLSESDKEMLATLSHEGAPGQIGESASTDVSEDPPEQRFRAMYAKSESRAAPQSAEDASNQFLSEVHELSPVVSQLYRGLLHISQVNPRLTFDYFKRAFQEEVSDWFGECVFRNVIRVDAIPLMSVEDLSAMHMTLAKNRRKNQHFVGMAQLKVTDLRMFARKKPLPILFEDAYVPPGPLLESPLPRSAHPSKHLFILVHGFQGTSLDLRLFKNHVAFLRPNYLFLCSSCNQDNTDGDIRAMGQRLAFEVKNFAREWCADGSLHRMSFIGHSLGGLVIRAALEFLCEFESQMELLVTLSSPHLGCMYNESKLIDAGLWFLTKWRKSLCLSQLTMTDAPDPPATLLFSMCATSRLRWFRNILLISSAQDLYAPFESARIEVSPRAATDLRLGNYYGEMARKVLAGVETQRVRRIDVNFEFTEKTVDSVIGRKAHIEFLEDQTLVKMLLFMYPELFP